MDTTALHLHLDADGLLNATLQGRGHRPPLLDAALLQALAQLAERLETDPAVRGAVLRSEAPDFLAGADLALLPTLSTAQQAFDAAQRFKAVLRRIERCGKPVAAALQGRCLGAGLDLALACHHRVLLADAGVRLGFPEVRWGVLPAGGGTQRLPRLIGLQRALPWLTEGIEADAEQARAAGLVQALADSPADFLQQARAWALAQPVARQPWDEPGFRLPGGDSRSAAAMALFAVAPSAARARPGPHLPAETHVLSCLFEGGLLDMDNALTLESRFFAAAVISPESRQRVDALMRERRALRRAADPA